MLGLADIVPDMGDPMMAEAIARRRKWKKFGDSMNDEPGPNPGTTIISDEVLMQVVHAKEAEQPAEQETKDVQKGYVKCRLCQDDHWTKQCPDRELLEALFELLMVEEEEEEPLPAPPTKLRYVPPALRAKDKMLQKKSEPESLYVGNLSKSATRDDVKDLFGPFGELSRIFVGSNKDTNEALGYAFVSYKRRQDGERAIRYLNGYGYDHLILSVGWVKSSKPE